MIGSGIRRKARGFDLLGSVYLQERERLLAEQRRLSPGLSISSITRAIKNLYGRSLFRRKKIEEDILLSRAPISLREALALDPSATQESTTYLTSLPGKAYATVLPVIKGGIEKSLWNPPDIPAPQDSEYRGGIPTQSIAPTAFPAPSDSPYRGGIDMRLRAPGSIPTSI